MYSSTNSNLSEWSNLKLITPGNTNSSASSNLTKWYIFFTKTVKVKYFNVSQYPTRITFSYNTNTYYLQYLALLASKLDWYRYAHSLRITTFHPHNFFGTLRLCLIMSHYSPHLFLFFTVFPYVPSRRYLISRSIKCSTRRLTNLQRSSKTLKTNNV